MEPRPVPSPFRLLVPLAGLGGMPGPASSPPISSSSMGGQARHSTVSVSGGGRASVRWPPAHRYLSRGAANCPRPLSVLPANLPRFPS